MLDWKSSWEFLRRTNLQSKGMDSCGNEDKSKSSKKRAAVESVS